MQTNKRLAMLIFLLFLAVLCIIHLIRSINSVAPESGKIEKIFPVCYKVVKFEEHNFLLHVPVEVHTSESFPSSALLETSWMQGSQDDGDPLFCVTVFQKSQKKANPLEWKVEVRVGVTTDPNALEDLLAKSIYTKQSPNILLINQIPFSVFPIQDAGMMKAVSGYSYRTIHEGKGYVLEVLSYGSTYKDGRHATLIREDQLKLHLKAALEIVTSFDFMYHPPTDQ
jgi:hypothetical protein